jgi:hypothetical protein
VSYVIEIPSKYGHRPDIKIDLPRFAADLAKELGGKLQKPDTDYPNERQRIQIGADMLELGANNWKKRVTASLSAPEIKWGDWSTYDKAQKTESASVNPDGRSIAAIAKDIRKRVIEANQPALAARRAYAAQQQQNREDIVRHADALKAAHPTLNVRVNQDKQSAEIYTGASGHYIDAALSSSGKVSIRRLGDVSAEQFAKIMAVLGANNAEANSQ